MFFRRGRRRRSSGVPAVLQRVARLASANINAALDEAEDPEKVLNQLVRDYTSAIREAEAAVAEVIASLRLMEKNRADAVAEHASLGDKAQAASHRADRLRAQRQAKEADRSDRLAVRALTRRAETARRVERMDPTIAAQTEVVDQLQEGLVLMRDRLTELKEHRSDLIARARTAAAQEQVVTAMTEVSTTDPTSEVSRVEEAVRVREARVQGRMEVATSSLEAQLDDLERLDAAETAHADLAAIKQGHVPAQIEDK